MKKIVIAICVIMFARITFAQEEEPELIGSLAYDGKIAFENTYTPNGEIDEKALPERSVWLAAGLSAVIPGAGELYNKSYLKSAIFFAAEVTAVTVGLIYDKKGDNKTAEFEDFALRHWSVARYALWTITNLSSLNPTLDPADYGDLFNDPNRTQVNWDVLNRLEEDIGGYYSHRLAPFKDQQYFEMIGKYQQFNPGWDDFGDENTPYTYGDPLTDRYLFYSHLRGEANSFYNIAGAAVIIVIVNHVISAIDAAWTTARYNKSLKTTVSLRKQNIGYYTYYYPEINFKLNF